MMGKEKVLLFHIFEDLIDDHIESFSAMRITDDCYLEESIETARNKIFDWHLSEIKKADLKARLDEMIMLNRECELPSHNDFEKRIAELQSELRKLEEGQ